MVRKTLLQAHLSAMREKRSSNQEPDESDDEAADEEAMQVDDTASTKFEPVNFSDPIILNHIADVFQLCKSKSGSKNLSCLLYMTLRYFGHSWDVSDDFLTTVGAFTSM